MHQRLISLLGIAALGLWGAEARAWTDVCWSSHTDYFERRSEYLEFTYSSLNVTIVQAVYFVGRPTYIAISEIDDIAFDAVTGLGGGPWGVVRSVLYGQGLEIAMALLRDFLEDPQHLATETGARTMEKGISALQENRRLYGRGVSELDETEKLQFRRNQVYVDLMGPAKSLYLTARDDQGASSPDGTMLSALSAVEETLRESDVLGTVLTLAELTDILLQSGIDLETYGPYRDYQREVDLVREANGIIPCAEARSDAGNPEPEAAVEDAETLELPQDYIPMLMCTGESIDSCRQYCYATCDHDADGSIRGGAGEGTCYADCNNDCDRLCISTNEPTPDDVPLVEAYLGGSITLSGLLSAPMSATLDEAGLAVRLPDGSRLSCMEGETDPAYGCADRLWSPNGYMANRIVMRGFRRPGSYLVYLDASRSSSNVTLHVGNVLVERWSRTASAFDGDRGASLEFEEQTVAAGEAVLLAQIVVEEE